MNEFITRFTFQENNSSQNTYYNNIEKQKLVSFVTTSNKTMSAIAEDEINLLVKFLHALINRHSICVR